MVTCNHDVRVCPACVNLVSKSRCGKYIVNTVTYTVSYHFSGSVNGNHKNNIIYNEVLTLDSWKLGR